MKIDHIQTSFAAGELGGSLLGRTDLDQYNSACATVENMLIRPYGSVISAPGTKYVAEVKNSSARVVLKPFIFSRTDAYVLELGNTHIRFYKNAGVVVSTGTTPFEVTTPYTAAQLADLQFAQLNDVIYFFHPSHHPRKLTRVNASYFTFADIAFECEPFRDDNDDDAAGIIVSDSTGTINVTASGSTTFIVSSGTTRGDYGMFWKVGSTRTNAVTGLAEQGFFKVTDVVSTTVMTASVINQLTVSGATVSFGKPAWTTENGYPSAGAFFSGRLYTAASTLEPQKIWGSRTYIYDDFSLNGAAADDGINIQVAASEYNKIQWLSAGGSLIAGTFGGEFIVTGGDAPLTPTNISVKQQSSWGSEPIPPRRIGNYFYYIQRFGKKLRELFYFWDLDSYKSVDRTILSPQILGKGVVEMTYQQNPDTIVYCVRTDGSIAAMTREIDQEMTAWSRLTTDGVYESVCAIPAATEMYDQVWAVVKRTITPTTGTVEVTKRYIEVFQNIDVPTRQDLCWYAHCALRFNAFDETAALGTTTLTVTGLSLAASSGTSVVVTTSAAYFNSGDVNQRIRAIDADGVTVGEMKITSYGSTTVVAGDIKKTFDALAYAGGSWGVSVENISGLSFLEGKEVTILADGGLDKPAKTVSMGSITLSYDYFVVLVGLPYTQVLKTLPFETDSERGTTQGKIQRINQVGFKVNNSYRGFKVGGTQALAERIQFRDPATEMGSPELLYTGTIPNITFRDDYRYGSQVVVVNEDPLPVEMLSIISTVDTNSK